MVTASAGGALLITGILLNLKVNSMSKDLENHYLTSTNSSRENYKTFSQVSYGVGAACVAGGAVLYYLGLRSGNASSAQVTLAPALAPAPLSEDPSNGFYDDRDKPGLRGFEPRRCRSGTRFSWFQTTLRPVVIGVSRGLVGFPGG